MNQNDRHTFQIGPTAQVGAATAFTWYHRHGLPGRWRVVTVHLIPDEAQTANGTNFSTYTLAKNGTTLGSRSYAATNSVAGTAEAITPSASGTTLELVEGDVLSWAKTVGGTGLAGTNRVQVVIERIS